VTLVLVPAARGAEPAAEYDIIIRGGLVYDGLPHPPQSADVAIRGDTIAAIGDLSQRRADQELDARGMAVTPGFINTLSWAAESLLQDGRSQSDIRQGVTLEVFGEGWSMGPLNGAMRRDRLRDQGDIKYDVKWSSLAGFLQNLLARGVSPNVASLVGATTVRIHALAYDDRAPSATELAQMRELVREEMKAGALGIGSSLIYAPGVYARKQELTELCREASAYGGIYMSHVRSEGNGLVEAVEELIDIARAANIPAEIYHFKAAGRENWHKFDEVIQRVDAARAAGLRITADVYPYTAGGTGLSAAMPPWVQEGGFRRFRDRLREPQVRQRVMAEMRSRQGSWENLLQMAGSADNVLLVGFKSPGLKPLAGKSLGEVARHRGQSPEETALDLVIEDGSRVECIYFLMSEDNVRKAVALPWVSFCSDAPSLAPEGVFLLNSPHPRAYGSFARVLAKYVRAEQCLPLELAIHKLSGLPARNFGLRRRGLLQPGYFADVVVLDPTAVQDHATYDEPHQFATGVRDVLVNGRLVLHNGQHTGAKPGRALQGPGIWRSADHRRLVKVSDEARRIHQAGFVFDGHNDLPWEIRTTGSRSFERLDISRPQPQLHTDLPRLRQGNVGAQFWSVYVPADTMRTGQALVQTLEQIDLVQAMVERYGDSLEIAKTAADVRRIQAAGKIASLIGVEGGHSIEDSLANLRRLRDLGASYMTLTHSDSLTWVDSATDEARSGGLSAFGEEVVREMNRLGMLVDLSHVSVEAMQDALSVTRAPVIFSHSGARTVADHPRNAPDDVLMLLERNGGVVMVNFFSGFVVPESARLLAERSAHARQLKKEQPDADTYRKLMSQWDLQHPLLPGTVHDVADHIDHLVRVAGIDHVGLGSDFDGIDKLPLQLEDVSTYPFLTQVLLDRGYTEQEIHKIMSGNILRVMERVEEAARQLQNAKQ
jgi:N-acyl-D-amino-acid deacylase